jgi:hypothetical protein
VFEVGAGELFVELAELCRVQDQAANNRALGIAIGATVGGLALIGVVCAVLFYFLRIRKPAKQYAAVDGQAADDPGYTGVEL